MYYTTINSFPRMKEEMNLPFFLRAVGVSKYTEHIIRPSGQYLHEIRYCTEGEGVLIVEGEKYTIKPGDVYFIRDEVPHEYYRITDKWVTHFLIFGGYATEQLFQQFQWGNHEIFRFTDEEPLELLSQKIYLYSTEEDYCTKCKNSALVYEFIVEIFSQSKEKLTKTEMYTPSTHTLMKAKRYIEQYYFKDLKLESVAEYSGVTQQHLCRLFREHLHISPNHYLTQIRIRQAKIFLQETNDSIQTISEKVGFNTSAYFSSQFKKYENISPREFRSMTQK
nr:AraC family transcriptional regulator [Eubacterium sp.]